MILSYVFTGIIIIVSLIIQGHSSFDVLRIAGVKPDIMFIAIMQLPPLIVLGPLVIYAFTIAETTPAVIFLVWSILVSGSDAFLKPIFLGRGADVPMLAILLGATCEIIRPLAVVLVLIDARATG